MPPSPWNQSSAGFSESFYQLLALIFLGGNNRRGANDVLESGKLLTRDDTLLKNFVEIHKGSVNWTENS